jgi:signal transduction histidine kinase
MVSSQQLYFNHLSVNNGLSQGVNNCIYRDSRGFVWISSFDGLNRFDGVSCISFRSTVSGSSGLKGTLFLNILEDKQSNMWIGSNAGLNFYNRQLDQFQNFSIKGRNNEGQFYSPFYIDDQNNIWLQSATDIILFNPTNQTFHLQPHSFSPGNLIIKPYPSKPYQHLQTIVAVNNKRPVLWLGQVTDKSIYWSADTLLIPANRITAILQTGANNFWLGTNNGIYRYQKNNQLIPVNIFKDKDIKNISALHLDQNGSIWAGTLQQGLFRVDTASGKIIHQYKNSVYNTYTLAANQVQYIYSDDKGNLWVSVWGKGVDYTSLNKFQFNQYITKEEAVKKGADNFIRSIVSVNNELWFGTQSGGILVLSEDKDIKQSIRAGLPLSIEHLCADDYNNIWAATLEGLFIIEPISKKITKLPVNSNGFGPASNQYNYISKMPNGSMLVSTNAGLFIVSNKNKAYQFMRVKGVNSKDVFLTTYQDHLNKFYISTAYKGFAVYQLNYDSMALVKDVPMQASIKCFNEQPDSTLWIGSTAGLIKFNKYSLKQEQLITTSEGLSNQYIYGVVADLNYLWLSTNAGINRYDVKNKTIKIFTPGDGLQSNEFNTYSFYKTTRGEILFGGVNGLNSFYPAEIKGNSLAPQLILTGLQVNDVAYQPGINQSEINKLLLEYNQNTVGFQFTVIHYANAAGNSLSYTLQGYDKSWVTVTNKTLIRYANLPPGNFTLKVKAFNADGIESETTYSLPITIMAPWWKRWWFNLITALLLTGLAFLTARNYINRRLEKQRMELEKKQAVEKERNRISRDMHDDLGSGLTKIAILSEVVKKQLAEPEKAKEQLEKIAVSSRELVDNLQDIIWVLNPKNDNLESLSSYIREYALHYFEPFGIQVNFKYLDHFLNDPLTEEQRRNIFLTVKESFNNIAKHAWCNTVTVAIEEIEKAILISIEDDGKGFNVTGVRPFANGLKNMQNRIELVGGTYTIGSSLGQGTITQIKLPV